MKHAAGLVAMLLLAGCAGDPGPADAPPGPTVAPGQGMPEANATLPARFVPQEVHNASVDLQPAASAPPASFTVPAGATNLTVTVQPVQTGTCRAQYPEVDEGASDPRDALVDSTVVLLAPDGNRTDVIYDTTSTCSLDGDNALNASVVALAAAAGEWTVQVHGWGSGVRVGVVVVAS